MKHVFKSALAAAIVCVSVSTASATTFNIRFTQTGGGTGNWFGIFEAPELGGAVTSFSALIEGVTYNMPYNLGPPTYNNGYVPVYDAINNVITGSSFQYSGTFTPGSYVDGTSMLGLTRTNFWQANGNVTCSSVSCPGTFIQGFGTYEISQVPLPGALAMLASALGAFGFLGWFRKQPNTAS